LGATTYPVTPLYDRTGLGVTGSRPENEVALLRRLASEGTLAAAAAAAPRGDRLLAGAAYEVAWPVVFHRLTRRLELGRGHGGCAASVRRMRAECLDRFQDDVESVVGDILTHATKPIHNLEAWIASRLTAATVDGHRRQRGRRGALQRPRLPGWLATGLGHDPWLTALATEMLVWVGVQATAGTGIWPLEAWTRRRAEVTGDRLASTPAAVEREVTTVVAVMRQRPTWYEKYVERPLGRKQAPVLSTAGADGMGEPPALPLTDPGEPDEALLQELAAIAVSWIDQRLQRGEEARVAAVEVVGAVFGRGGAVHLDHAPHAMNDVTERIPSLLADQRVVERIVTAALAILAERR
jgi:hypothetical protein